MNSGAKNCFAVSLVLGIYALNGTPPTRRSKKLYRERVVNEVCYLANLTGLDLNLIEGLAGESEFIRYQESLNKYISAAEAHAATSGKQPKSYKIVIYDRYAKPVFVGGNVDPNVLIINLLLDQQHFNYIKSLTGCFSVSYFCEYCRRGFKNKTLHKNCLYTCPSCIQSPPCSNINGGLEDKIPCEICNREFFNNDCFNKHLVKNI